MPGRLRRRPARLPGSAPGEARLDLLEGHVVAIVDPLVRRVEEGIAVLGVAKLEPLRAGPPLQLAAQQLLVLGLVRARPGLVLRRRPAAGSTVAATGDPTFLGQPLNGLRRVPYPPHSRPRAVRGRRRLRSRPAVGGGRPRSQGALGFPRRFRSRLSLTASSRARFACVCCFFAAIRCSSRRTSGGCSFVRAAADLSNQADTGETFVACGPLSPCSGSYCTFAFSASVL